MKKQNPRPRCWNCKHKGEKFNIPFSGVHHHCGLLIEKAKAECDTFISMRKMYEVCKQHELNNAKS